MRVDVIRSPVRIDKLTVIPRIRALADPEAFHCPGVCSAQVARSSLAVVFSGTPAGNLVPRSSLLRRFLPSASNSSSSSPLGLRIAYFFLVFSNSRLHRTLMNRNMINMRTIATIGFRSRKGVRSARWGIFMFVNAGVLGFRRDA